MEKMQSINTAAPGCEWRVGVGCGGSEEGPRTSGILFAAGRG